MSYVHASLQGLQALANLTTVFGLVAGIAWGLLISFMPGVGGNVALALLLPLVYRFSLPEALAVLFGAHISTYFGGSVTSITLNIPASTKSLPLCWDGYPLASKGRGAYALRASAAASGIGGVIGAVALTLGIPVMRSLLNFLGPPEILLLALLGAILIAILSSGNLMKGLIAFAIGIILSWVGQDPITGIDRLTFGSLYLANGIQLADVAIGLFAVVQVIRLLTEPAPASPPGRRAAGPSRVRRWTARRNAALQAELEVARRQRQDSADSMLDGVWAVFRHWKLELYMALFGVFTGTVPGFGAPVAAVAAYGQAAQFAKSSTEFGTGAIEGVIAPQATDSAAEGGGMLPLLSLGIPTHEQQAILMAAFVTIGIAPGPTMLSSHLPTVFSIIWVIVIASLCMMVLGVLLARQFAKLTAIPVSLLVPVVMTISIVGAFAVNGAIGDVITTVAVGIAGYFCWKFNYSRINLIIGVVLGPIIESNLHITTTLYGDAFMLKRPLSAAITVAIIATIAAWIWQNARSRRARAGDGSRAARQWPSMRAIIQHARTGQAVTAMAVLLLFIGVGLKSLSYGALTGGDLGFMAAIGVVLSLANVGRTLVFGVEAEMGVGERLRRTSMRRISAHAPASGGTPDAPAAPPAPASTLPAGTVTGPAAGTTGVAPAEAGTATGVPGPSVATAAPAAAPATPRPSSRNLIRAIGIVAAFLVLTLLAGIIPASGVAFGLYTKFIARKPYWYAAVAMVITGLVVWALFNYVVIAYAVYGGVFGGL